MARNNAPAPQAINIPPPARVTVTLGPVPGSGMVGTSEVTFNHISVVDVNSVGVYLINGNLEAVAFFPHPRVQGVVADRDVVPTPPSDIIPVSAMPPGGKLVRFPN